MPSVEAQVAAAPNPKEAMLVIARALDVIIENLETPLRVSDTWGGWETRTVPAAVSDTFAPPPERSEAWLAAAQQLAESNGAAVEIIEGEDSTDVVFRMPDEATLERRRLFARQALHLSEFLPDDGTDWDEVYAKGGPMWLYLGNRELVMSYPDNVKQAMVVDVEQWSPRDAQEMGRDILKFGADDTGPGRSQPVAEGNIG